MNISILNALWSILVGEKLDLDDPKLAEIIKMFDNFFRQANGPSSTISAILPHSSMVKWPGVNFTNILRTSFLKESVLRSFSLMGSRPF